ncbi:DUF502 domain-containing protein [Candidatus Nanosalina sp. VS9-1]|uniref:DUF502 domain-containing protein n=1 Tax=Candidatus Nanosalina sp. VS9-1 TaxID=3388566 RepID=UPI0039E1A4BD
MGFFAEFKKSFISGLVMALPFILTLVIVGFVVEWASFLIDPVVQATGLIQFTGNFELLARSIAAFIVVILLAGLGFISNKTPRSRFRVFIRRVISDIPLLGSIYVTITHISESMRGTESRFKKIVLLEYPKDGIYTLGLVTADAPSQIEDEVAEDAVSVFIPFSPNPTMGSLIMISEEDFVELDMSVRKGLKLLLTTGISFEEKEIPESVRGRIKEL